MRPAEAGLQFPRRFTQSLDRLPARDEIHARSRPLSTKNLTQGNRAMATFLRAHGFLPAPTEAKRSGGVAPSAARRDGGGSVRDARRARSEAGKENVR